MARTAAGLFQLLGVGTLLERFAERGQRAGNFTAAWEKTEEHWYRHMEEVFASEEAAAGTPWAPLSASYAAWKALRYGGKPILQASGALLESFTGGADSVRELTSSGLILGSRLKTKSGHALAALHQEGKGRLPVRHIIDIRPEFEREVHDTLASHLRGDG